MNSARLLVGVTMLVWLTVDAAALRAGEHSDKSKPLATFEIPKHEDSLLVPVRVGDQQQLFMLDTGCGLSAIDDALRSQAGKGLQTERFRTSAGRGTTRLVESPPILLAGIDLQRDGPVGVFDLGEIRSILGRDLRGVIGMSSLKRFAVQIDFDEGHVSLFGPDHSHDDWGLYVPLILNASGTPYVMLSACGVERQFLLDTGSDSTFIDPFLLGRLKERNGVVPLSRERGRTLAGDFDSTVYRLERFSAGTFQHEGLLVNDCDDNIVGLDYLSRYRVTLDFHCWRMYLQKGAHFDRRDNPDLSGLTLVSEQGQIVVRKAVRGGAAREAGIKAEDRLLSVDGKDASSMSLFEIRQLFSSEEGRKIPVEIKLLGAKVKRVVTLKPTPFHE